ncbi:MAG: hypothetical protein AABZ74_14950 [Cyanobacteriota bacterium]
MKKFLMYIILSSFIFIISCRNPIIDVYELSFANTPQSININGEDVFLSKFFPRVDPYSAPVDIKLYTKNKSTFKLPKDILLGNIFIFYYKVKFNHSSRREEISDGSLYLSTTNYDNNKQYFYDYSDGITSYIVIEIINSKKEHLYLKSDIKHYSFNDSV